MSSESHYDVLGVSAKSTAREIKLAYHRIALKHHPDRGPNADVTQFTRALNAHTVLSDPTKRRAYDHQLRLDRLREERHRAATETPATNDADGFNYAFPDPPFAHSTRSQRSSRQDSWSQTGAPRTSVPQTGEATGDNGKGQGDAGASRQEAARRAAKKAADSLPKFAGNFADDPSSFYATNAADIAQEFSRRRRSERSRFDAENIPEQQRPYAGTGSRKDHFGKDAFSGSASGRSTPEPSAHATPRQQRPHFRSQASGQTSKTQMKEAFNAETVIDLTGSTDEEAEVRPSSVHAPDPLDYSSSENEPSPQTYAMPQARPSHERNKRSATVDETTDTPAAKRSRFDMSGFHKVSPLTQTNGNFDLNSVSGAMPNGPTRTPRKPSRRSGRATYADDAADLQTDWAARALRAAQLKRVWDEFRDEADKTVSKLGELLTIEANVDREPELLARLEAAQAHLQQWMNDTKECSRLIHSLSSRQS